MPKLLAFLPCHRALVEKQDNTVSIISIIEGVQVSGADGSVTPRTAVIPFRWTIFTLWLAEANDTDRTFEQRIEILHPDGQSVASATMEFRITRRSQRNRVNLELMPVGVPGEQQIVLWIRELSTDQWTEVGRYPIYVGHGPGTEKSLSEPQE